MKPNHHSLEYKQKKDPHKKYKDLNQKQKAKIADWMYEKTCDYYREHNRMPEGEECGSLVMEIFAKIQSLAIWVPYEEVHKQYLLILLWNAGKWERKPNNTR